MDRTILLVGIGGLAGSILRYLVSYLMLKETSSAFPWPTFVVNLAGCFLMGVFVALSEKSDLLTPEWRIMLTTGFCGGFTTFSAFSYESVRLLQDGHPLLVAAYVGLSVVVGVACTWLGMLLVRAV
jgi:CrcB protein